MASFLTAAPRAPLLRAAIAFACVMIVGALLARLGQTTSTAGDPLGGSTEMAAAVPQVAPAWTLADADGEPHSLADLAGRPVLLNYWASWCPPCMDEMPSLQALASSLGDTDLAVVAITLDDKWSDAQTAMERTGFGSGILVVQDADRTVAHSYGTHKVPETYLIDRQGRIAHRFVGPRDWGEPQLVADVRAFSHADTQ